MDLNRFLRNSAAKMDVRLIALKKPIDWFEDFYKENYKFCEEAFDPFVRLAAETFKEVHSSELKKAEKKLRDEVKRVLIDSRFEHGEDLTEDSVMETMQTDIKKEEHQRISRIIRYMMNNREAGPAEIISTFLTDILKARQFYFRKDVVSRMPHLHWIVDSTIRKQIDDAYPSNFTENTRGNEAYKERVIELIDKINYENHVEENMRKVQQLIGEIEKSIHQIFTYAEIHSFVVESIEDILHEFGNPANALKKSVYEIWRSRFVADAMKQHHISDWFEEGFFDFYYNYFDNITAASLTDKLEMAKRDWDDLLRSKFMEEDTLLFKNRDELIKTKSIYSSSFRITLKKWDSMTVEKESLIPSLQSLHSQLILDYFRRLLRQYNEQLDSADIENILLQKTNDIAKNYDRKRALTGYLFSVLRNELNPGLLLSDNPGNIINNGYTGNYDSHSSILPLELVLLEALKNVKKGNPKDQLYRKRYERKNEDCKYCYEKYYNGLSDEFISGCSSCKVLHPNELSADAILLAIVTFLENQGIQDVISDLKHEVVLKRPDIIDTINRYKLFYNTLLVRENTGRNHCILHHKVVFLFHCFSHSIRSIWNVQGFNHDEFIGFLDRDTVKDIADTLNTALFEFTFRLTEIIERMMDTSDIELRQELGQYIVTRNRLEKILKKEQPNQREIEQVHELAITLIATRRQILNLLSAEDLIEQLESHKKVYWHLIDAFQLFIDGKTIEIEGGKLKNLKLLQYEKQEQ